MTGNEMKDVTPKKEEIKSIQLNFIDKVAEAISPSWFSSRLGSKMEAEANRALLSYSSNHGYTSTVPTLERPTNYGILRSEEAELPGFDRFQLIIETRNLYRNNPIIRCGVDGIARRVGIAHPHFQTGDANWDREAYSQWCDWCETCDVRGIMTFDEFQEQVPKSCYTDGDLGIQFFDVDGELKIDGKEGDLIAAPMRTDVNIDHVNPMGGIVWDIDTGKIKGYMVGRRGMGGMLIDTKEIPAEEFLLLFRRQRRDQMRGVPLLAPIIDTAKDLDDYLNSTRIQARIAATFGVVIKKNAAAQYGQNSSIPSQNANSNYRTMPLNNGKMTFLNTDEDIGMFKGDVPGPLFDSYAKFQIRMIARGMKSTYEMIMSDYTNMSFSSAKINMVEENALVKEWHSWKVRNMLKPIYSIWVAKRMENGKLPFNENAYTGVIWPAPAKIGIDPQSDADADIKLIASGLDNWEDYYKRTYGDPDWQLRLERKAEQAGFINQLAKKHGCNPLDIASTLQPGVVRAEAQEDLIASKSIVKDNK
jgi:lambda family phage portal protein